eukprot:TRINITY_DN1759_c0_g1_i1.p1 TRINITY_DN1759_c0_g1~~TRINITY_DN1759_c0_g1_i1.p1  ORF type:complete len:140 (-),score=25.46 TRINITY_DN1759_c0_g1_i1:9-428(-)
MQQPPCVNQGRCTQTHDAAHKDQFTHPCRHGASCNSRDAVHLRRFVHPTVPTGGKAQPAPLQAQPTMMCSKDGRCDLLNSALHMSQFLHSGAGQQVPQTQQPSFQQQQQQPQHQQQQQQHHHHPQQQQQQQQQEKQQHT